MVQQLHFMTAVAHHITAVRRHHMSREVWRRGVQEPGILQSLIHLHGESKVFYLYTKIGRKFKLRIEM